MAVNAGPGTFPWSKGPPGLEDVVGTYEVPDGLELKQVNIFVRHGERTRTSPVPVTSHPRLTRKAVAAVRKRLAGQGGLPDGQWDLCSLSKRFATAVVDFDTSSDSSAPRSPDRGEMRIQQRIQSQQGNVGTLWKQSAWCVQDSIAHPGYQRLMKEVADAQLLGRAHRLGEGDRVPARRPVQTVVHRKVSSSIEPQRVSHRLPLPLPSSSRFSSSPHIAFPSSADSASFPTNRATTTQGCS